MYKVKLKNGRAKKGEAYEPAPVEHVANILTHALCIAPSIIGMIWMISLSVNRLQYTVSVIYGLALFFLFTVSTAHHLLSYLQKCKDLQIFFHLGDRAVIYIFIASSYTPWLLLRHFDKNLGPVMMWIVWVCAAIGITYQYTFHEQYKWLELLLYLSIGVLPALCAFKMTNCEGLQEVFMGGCVYVLGVVFFKLDGTVPFAHAIWHCFVFVGAVVHFSAVCSHLLGSQNLPQ